MVPVGRVEWLGVVVWRVGCMWSVEECEVECVRMDGEMIGIYTIYIYIFIYLFMFSTIRRIRGTSRPVD